MYSVVSVPVSRSSTTRALGGTAETSPLTPGSTRVRDTTSVRPEAPRIWSRLSSERPSEAGSPPSKGTRSRSRFGAVSYTHLDVYKRQSPRRKELLRLIVPDFLVEPADVDERAIAAPTPAALVRALALAKCRAVAALRPADLVLGCDTVVDLSLIHI